jgi:hypothetical protein
VTATVRGQDVGMIWAFLSSRIRTWVLFAVLLPIAGRVLEAAAARTQNPRVGGALAKAGSYARDPRGRRRRR